MDSHGIALGPDDGEKVVREVRHHRILAELPEFGVIELRFGPEFEGSTSTRTLTTSTRSTCWRARRSSPFAARSFG